MEEFPAEIIEEILLRIDYYDRIGLSRVSNLWHIIVKKHRKRLYYGHNGCDIYVLDDTLTETRKIKNDFGIRDLILSSIKDKIMVSDDFGEKINILSTQTGEIISSFVFSFIKDVFWSYDDSILIIHRYKQDIIFYEIETREIINRFSGCTFSTINSRRDKIAFDAETKSSTDDTTTSLVIWDLNKSKYVAINLPVKVLCNHVQFSKDDQYIIISMPSQVLLYNTEGELVHWFIHEYLLDTISDYIHSKSLLINRGIVWDLRLGYHYTRQQGDDLYGINMGGDQFCRIDDCTFIVYGDKDSQFHHMTLPDGPFVKTNIMYKRRNSLLSSFIILDKFICAFYNYGDDIMLIDIATLKLKKSIPNKLRLPTINY